jgi:outer membrane protein TolC
VPADLLRRRPDLLAQEKRLLAADHRVGVAVAARLPSLSIGGRTGIQATNPDNVGQIFQQPVFGLNVDLVGPIIDGGRRAEEVKRVEAAVRDALAAMKSTLLRAITEVEDALTNERSQRAYLDKLDAQLQLARDTLGEARRRYANGLVDYLPVLSALAAVQQLERTRITAQRNVLAARISLHSALGGSWGDDLEGGDTIRAKKAEKAHDGDAAMTETPR